MFKMLNLQLPLISDPEMYRMIVPNIRGGICQVSCRYAKANNMYMGAHYDPTQEDSYILYIDANNLYGWAQSQDLPYHDYVMMDENEIREANEAITSKDRRVWNSYLNSYIRFGIMVNKLDRGEPVQDIFPNTQYIFEVDLEYPQEYHDRDDDYPLAPELMEVVTEMLSGKQMELMRKYYGVTKKYSKKLICSLLSKKHYVVHSELLKFYMERGLVVTKVHRGIRYKSDPFVKKYIEYNAKQRAAAGDDECLRTFYKIMNNALYGRFIMLKDKQTDIRLLVDEDKARRLAEKPHCMQWCLFDDDLIGVEMRKIKNTINVPFQVGFAILELSKLHMYRAYAKLKDHYKENVRLLYTDTDSFILQFKVHDLYKELRDTPVLREMFDFSKIPQGHPSGCSDPQDPHADEIGYFKDELKGDPIVEFVGLKPKMYSFTYCKSTLDLDVRPPIIEKQVGKGIARPTLKTLNHQRYVEMFNESAGVNLINRRILSKLHQIYTLEQSKRGLLPYDDKRFLLANLPDGSSNPNTHAYGHHSITDVQVREPEQPAAGAELIVETQPVVMTREQRAERRFKRKHRRAQIKAGVPVDDTDADNDDDDGDGNRDVNDSASDDDLSGAEWDRAYQDAAARGGVAGQMDNVINHLIAANNLRRPYSPPAIHSRRKRRRIRRPSHDEIYRRRIESSSSDDDEKKPMDPPSTSSYRRPSNVDPPSTSCYRRPSNVDPPSTSHYRRSDDDVIAPVRRTRPNAIHSDTDAESALSADEQQQQQQDDEQESEEEERSPRRRRRARRRRAGAQFIEFEAGVDGGASADEQDDEPNQDDLDFIVPDDYEE